MWFFFYILFLFRSLYFYFIFFFIFFIIRSLDSVLKNLISKYRGIQFRNDLFGNLIIGGTSDGLKNMKSMEKKMLSRESFLFDFISSWCTIRRTILSSFRNVTV